MNIALFAEGDTLAYEKTAWIVRAACRGGYDPDLWFSNDVEHIRGDSPETLQALQICAGCPVLRECRDYAIAREWGLGRHSRWGIYGGMRPVQRFLITKALKRQYAQLAADPELGYTPFSPNPLDSTGAVDSPAIPQEQIG